MSLKGFEARLAAFREQRERARRGPARRNYVRGRPFLSRGQRLPAESVVASPTPPPVREKPIVFVTHIAGYVPPKGSIVESFRGRVIHPVRGLGA